MSLQTELRTAALACLSETETGAKVTLVTRLATAWQTGQLSLESHAELEAFGMIPGRPVLPRLVSPREVPRRSMAVLEGRAALIHALAHIEFNAINLALDAIWRFPRMPENYYRDWLRVAAEEALHFRLLSEHLQTLGYVYGDFPAHNGLWEMAEKTCDDVLARMALIPRTIEARGLDVTPGMREKLLQAGDIRAGEILEIILRDEIGHVAIGNHWFHWLCAERQLEPMLTYATLMARYDIEAVRKPFNVEARRAAGFSESELSG